MKLKEIVPHYYSKNILVRVFFWKRLYLAIQLAQRKLNLDDNLKVIDLGCGQGIFLGLLEKEFKNIKTFGVDIEPCVLEAKKFLKAKIKIADIRNSGFPKHFFDIVFCLDVLEHFKNLEEPIREIKRILKPNGLLVVSLPTENLFYKLGRFVARGVTTTKKGPHGPHFHKAKTIEQFLLSNGFKVVEKKLLPPIPFFILTDIISFKKK